ncbi:unnamed protein product [Brachionus calyciflorus]|uniref:Uncharacterized protein n=1 Tax=Brachionus calyciflorus TaxID=104777 RepID=A0A814FVE7_9BILA|nr:unnamed protein product [Brachionus calyciflorus]
MTRNYSVKSSTRRWPVQVFYNIHNFTSITSWVLYKKVNKSQIPRRDFLAQLVKEISKLNDNYHQRYWSKKHVPDPVVVATRQPIPVPPSTKTATNPTTTVPKSVITTSAPKFTNFSNQSRSEFSFNGSPILLNNPFDETVVKGHKNPIYYQPVLSTDVCHR